MTATAKGGEPPDRGKVLEREWRAVRLRRLRCREAFLKRSQTCYVKSVDRALKARDQSIRKYFSAVKAKRNPDVHDGLAGLALSGGGVRSATFNLGVLQRLHELGILQKLDYLSTVSGGGYIGCGLTAYRNGARSEAFPFWPAHEPRKGENFALRHLRRFSSYIVARGWQDALVAALTALGGTLANLVVLVPYLLVLAVLAVVQLRLLGSTYSIWVSAILLAGALVLALVQARRQARRNGNWSDREQFGRAIAGIGALALLVAAWMVQPVLLEWFAKAVRQVTLPKVTAAVTGAIAASLLSAARLLLASPILRRPAISVLLLAVMAVLLWLIFAALGTGLLWLESEGSTWGTVVAGLVLAVALIALGSLLPANCGSLHVFYRDRLSKAYFFKPRKPDDNSLEHFHDCQLSKIDCRHSWKSDVNPLEHFDDCQLSRLDVRHSPYLLINACLNVSDTPSPREDLTKEYVRPGRLGTFFLFSRRAVGNDSIGYVSARTFEKENGLMGSLATAMAISGAAFGANMGYNTNRAAVFLLTLLNVRTGCWVSFRGKQESKGLLQKLLGDFAYLTLCREAVSRFDNKSGDLLLTDGGHVDNLGLYQLLKRRCSLIIASDAEADPKYAFEGLAAAVRLAKIDLNVEVEIDYAHLAAIRDGKRHFAVGRIRYPDPLEGTGTLIYLKSSLTDEALRDVSLLYYHRSNAAFPHETTADQFFTEQQFEAYRALGRFVCRKTFEGPETT